MPQVNLYVPDQLHDELLAAGAELNWSSMFQEAARDRLSEMKSCTHQRIRCRDCGVVLDRQHA